MHKTEERLHQIFNAVCIYYGITIEELKTIAPVKRQYPSWDKRKGLRVRSCSRVAKAKQVTAYLVKNEELVNHRQLAILLGYKRPQSITDNVKIAMRVLSVDKTFQEEVQAIKNTINEQID